MLNAHGAEKIVVGVDVRSGTVATAGWLSDSNVNYLEFIDNLKAMGVKYVVVTDITRDGTLTSPNWDMYKKIKDINVIISGGVAEEDHFRKAAEYYGIIIGKAFYEGKVDLKKCFLRMQTE
jgi:phosphoribosylformimino-5-aminoimidazole carboxamide ribotide isomerase